MRKPKPVETTGPAHGLLREKKKKFSDEEATYLLFGKSGTASHVGLTAVDQLTRIYYLSIAFYLGQQTRTDLSAVSMLTDWFEPTKDEVMYVANHIAPMVSRQINRFLSSDGHYYAIPATPDFRDQRGAKAATNVLHYLHGYTNLRAKRRALAMWMVLCGTGALYADWDDNAGAYRRIYRDPFDPDRIMDASRLSDHEKQLLQAMGSVEEKAEGDITTAALSPFELDAPDSYADIDEAPWIRIQRIRSLEWVWDHYPKLAPDVRPETIAQNKPQQFIRRMIGLASGINASADLTGDDNSVTVTEWWRPPSAMMRDGALLVGAGNVVLHNGPHPSVDRELDIRYPVSVARFRTVPLHWRGQGMVQDLIDPQMEYNRSRTQIIQQRDMLAHPQWSGSAVPERRRNNYGDFWLIPKGEQIELHQPPALSQAHLETKGAAIYDEQIIASQGEASQGMNPAGVRSGNALSALQERDMETLGPAFEELETALQDHSEKSVKLFAKMATTPRAVSVHGKATMADVVYLKGMDLRGNTKIKLVPGSTRPRSQAAMQERLGVMLQSGGLDINDPDVRRFVFKAFEFHDLNATFLTHDLAERRAEQENELFAAPGTDTITGARRLWPAVRKHDNHTLHKIVHQRFMETDEFENLPVDQQLALEAHVFIHEQEIVKQMMALQAQQGPPQGSQPKEAGKPSPPKAQKAQPA